jgi:hypothetical protein
MLSAALAGGVLVVAGLPLAFALTRRVLSAMVLAPLVSALLATVAVMAMLAVGGSLWVWLAVVSTLQAVLAVVLLRAGMAPVEHATTADALWLTIPLLPPAATAIGPPIGWDAHSIWWFHAGYFTRGGEVARQAMSEPGLAFSHPDYPPLPSAPVAVVWQVFGAADFHVARAVSATITLSAIVLLAFAVRRVLGFAPPVAARLAGVLVALATWATDPATVTAGYSDALWAAAFVAGALPMLLGQPARPVDAGLLAVAALSKNEAFLAVVMLAVLLTVLRRPARWWLPWLPVAAGGSWALLSRMVGATSDLQAGGRFAELLTLDPAVWQRLAPTVRAIWAVVGNVVTVAVVVALLGTLALRGRRRRLGLSGDGWLWCVAAGYALLLVLAYLISPHDIDWHLGTSVARVSLPLVLLACASCAIWAGVALRRAPHTSGAEAKAEADAGTAQPVDAPAGR